MPPVAEQMRTIGVETADFCSARFLLRPGRTYEQAVKAFTPYTEIKEPNPEARIALTSLLGRATFSRARRRYIYVNNRLEGCAPWTIVAALEAAVAGAGGGGDEMKADGGNTNGAAVLASAERHQATRV
jgi:hypothetical protein